MSDSTFTATLTDQVAAVLDEVERATQAFAAASGIRCRDGCGQCCLKPGVDVRPIEFLPLARELLAQGRAEAAYADARADPDGVCVFYQGQATDATMGRCGVYDLRPSLCRLFGFAAVSGKRGPELAACHWHKRLQPEVVKGAQRSIDDGGTVPHFSDVAMRLSMLAPGSGMEHVMPINRAFALALEKAALVVDAGDTSANG